MQHTHTSSGCSLRWKYYGTRVNTPVWFTSVRKARRSLRRFSWNSRMPNSIICSCLVPNFAHTEQCMWKVKVGIHKQRQVKHAFHCTVSQKTDTHFVVSIFFTELYLSFNVSSFVLCSLITFLLIPTLYAVHYATDVGWKCGSLFLWPTVMSKQVGCLATRHRWTSLRMDISERGFPQASSISAGCELSLVLHFV
jgi:hypothetical protein